METNPSSLRKSKLVRFVIRPLLVLVGTVAMCVTAYQLVMNLAFKARLEATSPTDKIVLPIVHLIAVVFFLALAIWTLRRMKWFNRFWESLFTWRTARRALVGFTILATLFAILYAEENWRGRRAWERCKRDLETQGEVLEWSAYVPAPIPDEQNIIKAPKMTEWFVKPGLMTPFTNELGPKMIPSALLKSAETNARTPILIAHVFVVATNSQATSDGDVVVRLDAVDGRERLGRIMQEAVGSSMNGPQAIVFVQSPLSQIKPRRVLLQTAQRLSVADLSPMFPPSLVSSNVGHLRVETDAEANSFRLMLDAKPVVSAADYLAWSDSLAPEFDLIREALKRPQIRMESDFQWPFEIPIVNFVFMRNLAQTLASRAQCCLLLGRPEQAVRELSLIVESRRLLTTKPTTLVAAMIDVAICGLYVETIADGFRLQAWREPQLAALQKQLQKINLLRFVESAFECERVAACRTFETIKPKELNKIFSLGETRSFWQKIKDPKFQLLTVAPRGWIYQNMAAEAKLLQKAMEGYDSTNGFVSPKKINGAGKEIEALPRWSPYTFLASIAIPNFIKATQTAARNETRVNEGQIVCALERYRVTHGDFPATPEALVPRFIEKLPHDIIGGQPLKYRRTDDGRFLLYSIGWNETDDGGKTTFRKDGSFDFDSPDWVWQSAAR